MGMKPLKIPTPRVRYLYPTWIVIILHDHVTAFLHGHFKIFIFSKKGYSKNQYMYILRLSNSTAPKRGKRHLLMSLEVSYDTTLASRDKIGNVTLTAQGFILHFTTKLILQSYFSANYKLQYAYTHCHTCTQNNTHELKINVNPISKKLKLSCVTFYFPTKNFREKNNPS